MNDVRMTAGAPPASPATSHLHQLPITWSGSPWSLTGLAVLNFLLTVVTLGIYSFWGKTEVRRRIWHSVHIAGEPLEYTGTGRELFLGFAIAMGVVFLPLVVLAMVAQIFLGASPTALGILQLVFYAGGFYLVGVAGYRARRYRLSRTNWRGIRGALEGSSWRYGWTYFWTLAAIPAVAIASFWVLHVATGGQPASSSKGYPILLGALALVLLVAWLWLIPWRATLLQRRITDDMSFGSQAFTFVGSARPLYARFIARWIGVVILAIATAAAIYFTVGDKLIAMSMSQSLPPTSRPQLTPREIATLLGILLVAFFLYSIITAWYRAAQANLFAQFTRFQGVPFGLAMTAGGLIWIFATNFLLTLATFGLLRPVAEARAAKYAIERLSLEGPVDLAAIEQSRAELGRSGEGLAQAFDVDAF